MLEKVLEKVDNFIDNIEEWDEDNYPLNWSNYHWRLHNIIIEELNNYSIDSENNQKDINLEYQLEDFKKKMGYNEGVNKQLYGYIQLNDNFREIILSNINLITFQSLYPFIMIYLYKKKLFEINKQFYKTLEFLTLNEDILNNIINSKYYNSKKDKMKKTLKVFKNYFIVCLFSEKKDLFIESKGKEYISYIANMFMYNLYYKLGENSVYCDTDCLYFVGDESLPEFFIKTFFDNIDIKYKIEKIDNVIFFAPKKLIYMKNGDLKIKGFPKKSY